MNDGVGIFGLCIHTLRDAWRCFYIMTAYRLTGWEDVEHGGSGKWGIALSTRALIPLRQRNNLLFRNSADPGVCMRMTLGKW